MRLQYWRNTLRFCTLIKTWWCWTSQAPFRYTFTTTPKPKFGTTTCCMNNFSHCFVVVAYMSLVSSVSRARARAWFYLLLWLSVSVSLTPSWCGESECMFCPLPMAYSDVYEVPRLPQYFISPLLCFTTPQGLSHPTRRLVSAPFLVSLPHFLSYP